MTRTIDSYRTTGFGRPSATRYSGFAPSQSSLSWPCGEYRAQKPYRPHNPAKHALLVSLALEGRKHRDIAAIYGGTVHGVRSNLRRLRERGEI